MYREVKAHERLTERLTKSQLFGIVPSCLASFHPSFSSLAFSVNLRPSHPASLELLTSIPNRNNHP